MSGTVLSVETCRSGLIGAFPALNPRTTSGFAEWLVEIEARLSGTDAAPHAVNLIVRRSNSRLDADLEVIVRHRVPLVIASLGANAEVVQAVQAYGGAVFHDVISRRHAEKAAEAGVDGIIAVCAGAGGHGGTLSPFALLPEIRAFFDGTLVLAGAISTGEQIAAARVMGADLAYLGTRFLATREAMVAEGHKSMILAARASDIVHTAAVSGVAANFLRASLVTAGVAQGGPAPAMDVEGEARAWRDVWSAGQGVGSIEALPAAADLCRRLTNEYRTAVEGMKLDRFATGAGREIAP
jgi:nitronate monooxygenase